jgi:hypothetical protein
LLRIWECCDTLYGGRWSNPSSERYKKMKKKVTIILIVLAVILVGAEVVLRYYGFCDAVLFREDPDFEYIANPNQERFRYGNHIRYNSNSMRSEEVDTSAYVIIGFGDSIINGGQQTDNDALATTILSDTLSVIQGRKVQFLNVSEKSWGPDNHFEYLKKYGRFGAHEIFLFVSSHDAHDTMTFEKVVGVDEDYPSKQYALALLELADRYIRPRLIGLLGENETENLAINDKKESGLNGGFMSFLSYSKDQNIPITIYLHAEAGEVEARSYNQDGQEIIKFAKDNNVPLILDLENGLSMSDFRDYIHINPAGQKKLAEIVLKHVGDAN